MSNLTEREKWLMRQAMDIHGYEDLNDWLDDSLVGNGSTVEDLLSFDAPSDWIVIEQDGLPSDELLNNMGRRKFLCIVNYTGTMINVRGIDVFMFTKSDGFLVADKGSLVASITEWMELPELPPIPDSTSDKG